LEKKYLQKVPAYTRILNMLQDRLRHELVALGLHPAFRSRVKSFESYYDKILNLLAKNKSRHEACLIYDVMGLRIVCPFLDDLNVVEEHIARSYEVFEIEHKGSEQNFWEFGYKSIHFLIKVPPEILSQCCCEGLGLCEIQLRTILQDAWSEVEHELIYKSDSGPLDEPMKRKLAALNANLTLSDTLFQEIRDFQRTLQAQLQKRRENFMGSVAETPVTAGLPATDQGAEGSGLLHKSVDDLLVDALDAHNAGQIEKAIKIYSAILNRKLPGHIKSIIHVHRGMAYFSQRLYQQAMKDFSISLELSPDNHRAYYYRGLTREVIQDYQGALEDFNACLEINPYQFDPLYSRARLRVRLKDYVKALADCNLALKIEPGSASARQMKQMIIQQLGDTR